MLDKIKFTYKETDKTGFTPSHVVYKCKIKYMGLQYTFEYQCNPNYNDVTKKEAIYALLSDIQAYDNTIDVDDFLKEFGYYCNDIRKGLKVFKTIKKERRAIHRLFTDEEIKILEKEVEIV